MERDHDYVASGTNSFDGDAIDVINQNAGGPRTGSRNSSDDEDAIDQSDDDDLEVLDRIVRGRRRILQLTTQNIGGLSNSDHNYVFAPVSASGSSSGSTSGTLSANDSDRGQPYLDIFGDSETDSVVSHSRSSENSVPSAEVENDSTNTSEATIPYNIRTRATGLSSEIVNPLPTANVQEESVPSPTVPLETNEDIINLSSPSPPKKRKRLSLEPNKKGGTPNVKSKSDDLDDEDDGLTCPICLDNWEMSGEHRLSSLKCGHLFGESCIRRWLQESARQSGLKVCPQCKTKANPRDIRYLYAKRLRAIDRSEEHRMREQLNQERSKSQNLELELATMKMSYSQVTHKIKSLEADNETLKRLMRKGGTNSYNASGSSEGGKGLRSYVSYKLFMEKNIELSREPGCRVMTYADQHSALIVSQKSSQGLFPGYGLRFIDTPTFKPSNFLHTSVKMVRDISLSDDQQLLVVASMEQKAKLFDLRTLQAVTTFKPAEKPLWSCAIARKEGEYYLYLGSQHGSTYVYDTRYPETFLDEHQTEGDCSPVIQIESVPESEIFPCGGFIICKLTSLWFYENIQGGGVNATRLTVEGRLISMSYDINNLTLLVQTRSCQRHPRARHILGTLNKIDCIPVFELKVTFFALTNSPVMVRSTQIAVDSNNLVAAYIQDKKLLSVYDANSELCIQSLPVQEVVYDTCPVYSKDLTYLAALTETKCRLYKLTSTAR